MKILSDDIDRGLMMLIVVDLRIGGTMDDGTARLGEFRAYEKPIGDATKGEHR